MSTFRWAFDTLDLNRVQAETDTRNVASARVLAKLGFVREGTLREDCIVNGKVSDSWVYGLIRRDWRLRSNRRKPAREVGLNAITSEPGVVELTLDEGRRMLDGQTRKILGIPLEDFEREYDVGTLDLDRSEVIGLVMLLPFAR